MSIVAGPEPPGRAPPTRPTTGTPRAPASAAPGPVRTPRTLAAAGDLLRALAAPVRIAIVLQLLEPPRACTTWSTRWASPSR